MTNNISDVLERQLTAELSRLDSIAQTFADTTGGYLIVWERGLRCPSVAFSKDERNVEKKIQVSFYLCDPSAGWTLNNVRIAWTAIAWRDVGGQRRLWHRKVSEATSLPVKDDEAAGIYELAWKALSCGAP